MASLSDDTLRKILQQIQTQSIQSQRQLSMVRAQVGSKEKERKILELTMRELDTVPEADTRTFRGVGKMFIEQPRAEINAQHTRQKQSLTDDITSLDKKAKYFAKQVEEANGQLRDIFHAQNRERS